MQNHESMSSAKNERFSTLPQETQFELKYRKVKFVYAMLILNSVILNMPSGSFSSSLKSIQADLIITDETIMGLISTMFFWGQILGCIVSLLLIEYNIRKMLLVISTGLCFGSLLAIGLTRNFVVLLVLRFVNGFGASFIAVSNPVWIDQYSLKKHSSIFMAFHNLSSVFGNILGVVLATLLKNLSWNYVFLIESFITAGSLIIIFLIKKKYFDRRLKRIHDSDIFMIHKSIRDSIPPEGAPINYGIDSDRSTNTALLQNLKTELKPSYLEIFIELIKNKSFCLLAGCVTILLFISTFMMNWIQYYIEDMFHISTDDITIMFVIVCVTSPVAGITVGGFLIQRIGGYHKIKAIKVCCLNTFFCFLIAVAIGFSKNLYLFGAMIWLYLFFGSMVDPCVNGALIRSLPFKLKGSGSSLAYIFSSIFGVSLGPMLYSVIYSKTKNSVPTLAMSFCLSVTLLSTLMLFTLIKLNKNNEEITSEDDSQSESEDPLIENGNFLADTSSQSQGI